MNVVEDKSLSPENGTGADEHNERLGSLLSGGLAAAENNSDRCLSTEEIAILVEGNIIGSERDRMMKHLSACNECYETYLLASELYEDETPVSIHDSIAEPKRNRFLRPLAMAASVMIVAFALYLFYNVSGIPKNSSEFADFSSPKKVAPSETEAVPGAAQPGEADDADSGNSLREEFRAFKSPPEESPVLKKDLAKEGSLSIESKAGKAGKAKKTEESSIPDFSVDKLKSKRKGYFDKSKKTSPPPMDNNTVELEEQELPEALGNRMDEEKPVVGNLKTGSEKNRNIKNNYRQPNKKGNETAQSKTSQSDPEAAGVKNKAEKTAGSSKPPKSKPYTPAQQSRIQQQQLDEKIQGQRQEIQAEYGSSRDSRNKDQKEAQDKDILAANNTAGSKEMVLQDGQVGASQGGVLNPSYQSVSTELSLRGLNRSARLQSGYLPAANLKAMLSQLLTLTRRLETDSLQLVGNDYKPNDYEPLVRLVTSSDRTYAFPDMNYLFSRSAPGSVEHRFFNLTRSGWCDSNGLCYSSNGNVVGWNAGKPEKEILLKQWRDLLPQLEGPYKVVADSTIKFLEKR
jgi:hypothetical protein